MLWFWDWDVWDSCDTLHGSLGLWSEFFSLPLGRGWFWLRKILPSFSFVRIGETLNKCLRACSYMSNQSTQHTLLYALIVSTLHFYDPWKMFPKKRLVTDFHSDGANTRVPGQCGSGTSDILSTVPGSPGVINHPSPVTGSQHPHYYDTMGPQTAL